MENYAVCRGNQHCLYYRLKNRQTQHSPGGWIPQLMQYKASRARSRRSGHSEARKNLTKIGAGNLGRNQSRLRWTPKNELNAHRSSNLNKLFWHSFKITKLRLRILPTNMPVLH